MDEVKATAVMMGSSVFAGIDREMIEEVPLCIVLEFSDRESLREALNGGKAVRISLEPPTGEG